MYLIQDAMTTNCSNKAIKQFKLNSALLQLMMFTSPVIMQVVKLFTCRWQSQISANQKCFERLIKVKNPVFILIVDYVFYNFPTYLEKVYRELSVTYAPLWSDCIPRCYCFGSALENALVAEGSLISYVSVNNKGCIFPIPFLDSDLNISVPQPRLLLEEKPTWAPFLTRWGEPKCSWRHFLFLPMDIMLLKAGSTQQP